MVKVAINGFGRIGRPFFRMSFNDPEIDIVAINNPPDARTFAHLIKYDSTFGTWKEDVSYDDTNLIVNGRKFPFVYNYNVAEINWADYGVDVVLDCSGKFRDATKAAIHLQNGAKVVLLSAPGINEDLTVCYGVNHELIDVNKHKIISNASCTTNAMGCILKVLDAAYGIDKGLMCTVHSFTSDQFVLDRNHRDLRRARTASGSIIPTTTGAAKAIGMVLPQLKGKLNGFSLRVPTPDVSIVDLSLVFNRNVTAEEINALLKEASENEYAGLIGYNDEPLVSIDYVGNSCSGIIDALSTMVVCDNMAKIVIWYDNEWGYCNRLKDVIKHIGEQIK